MLQGPTGLVLRALLVAATLLAAAPLQAAPDGGADDREVDSAPVIIDGKRLFRVRGLASLAAPERAAGIAGRISSAAAKATVTTSNIVVVPTPAGFEIQAAGEPLMRVTPADARFEGVDGPTLAEAHRLRIADAIASYRAARAPRALLLGAAASLAATAVFALLLVALGYVNRRLDAVLARVYQERIGQLEGKLVAGMAQSTSVLAAVRKSLGTARIAITVILGLLWLDAVLGQFPWTRWLSDGLGEFLLGPVVAIALAITDYIPSLIFLVVLSLVVRFTLRLLRLYFGALERERIHVASFDREWALPTYKIVRTLVLILALVMAYPYLPGSGSAAFQGVSVFAGLLVSLGAASAVSNVISGYQVTYGRILRLGDWVRVGEVFGVVSQVRLLTTRVRTFRNEEVTIPNSTIMTSSITNYSALARERGILLQAEVGIGYETPWRQVHAMLLEAARRTPGLRAEPPPFVLQRSLGDFAVVYQLNVCKGEPEGMLRTQSELHQHILDVFNEYGVQIMTPAYVADTPVPKVVPKDQWHLPPAAGSAGTPPAS